MRTQEIELYLVSFLTRCLLRVVLVIVAAYFALVGIIGIVGLSTCKVVYEIKLNF
jgi:hypothetical protein